MPFQCWGRVIKSTLLAYFYIQRWKHDPIERTMSAIMWAQGFNNGVWGHIGQHITKCECLISLPLPSCRIPSSVFCREVVLWKGLVGTSGRRSTLYRPLPTSSHHSVVLGSNTWQPRSKSSNVKCGSVYRIYIYMKKLNWGVTSRKNCGADRVGKLTTDLLSYIYILYWIEESLFSQTERFADGKNC